MNIPQPKYSIGQKVWHAGTTSGGHPVTCPDCIGKRVWYCTLPTGERQNIPCPTCDGRGTMSEWEYKPTTRCLTIGSCQLEAGVRNRITYMCEETGVGSGFVYDEIALFLTMDEAEHIAKVRANEANEAAAKRFIADLTARRKSTNPGSLVGYLRTKATLRRKEVEQIEAHIASLAKEHA